MPVYREAARSEAPEVVRRQRYRRGYWLRLARRRAGLSLREVAVALGYSVRSQTTIKLWEDGRRDPSDIALTRLAEIYGVPIEVFIRPAVTDEEHLGSIVTASTPDRRGQDRGEHSADSRRALPPEE